MNTFFSFWTSWPTFVGVEFYLATSRAMILSIWVLWASNSGPDISPLLNGMMTSSANFKITSASLLLTPWKETKNVLFVQTSCENARTFYALEYFQCLPLGPWLLSQPWKGFLREDRWMGWPVNRCSQPQNTWLVENISRFICNILIYNFIN